MCRAHSLTACVQPLLEDAARIVDQALSCGYSGLVMLHGLLSRAAGVLFACACLFTFAIRNGSNRVAVTTLVQLSSNLLRCVRSFCFDLLALLTRLLFRHDGGLVLAKVNME